MFCGSTRTIWNNELPCTVLALDADVEAAENGLEPGTSMVVMVVQQRFIKGRVVVMMCARVHQLMIM